MVFTVRKTIRIEYYDLEYDRTFVFLTNNKRLKPQTIAKLYKSRWHVELFFKWIKQHLKIKSFWGQNENAVRIQIWVAISTYLIVAIAKRKLNIQHSLYEILQYITIAPFEKEPLSETFANGKWEEIKDQIDIQLNMF
jgi:IS4 transposase